MRGRYKIVLPALLDNGIPRVWEADQRIAKRWHVFVEICRSLAADGLNYTVTLVLASETPHILITAWGDAIPKRKPANRAGYRLPPPVKPEKCAIHALEAAWFLPENQAKRNAQTTHWRGRTGRYTELSEMAVDELRADQEYWRELELLSGQREHFKPGRTDETARFDDEVAA